MAAAIGTWTFSLEAMRVCASGLMSGDIATEAVIDGVSAVEADPKTGVYVVGRGGYPNAAGVLQCDAAVMDGKACCFGAVAALEGVATPIRVARRLMDKAPPAFLVGEGATRFARQEGFQIETNSELLGPRAIQAWQDWKKSQCKLEVDGPGHDTLGLIGRDCHGNLTAGVSTSGAPFKRPGRVGDSPLPGGGLYADNACGAACCTGDGDLMLRFCPTFHTVDLMSRGLTPQRACETVTKDISKRLGDSAFEMGIVAMDTQGLTGASGTVETWTDVLTGQTYAGFPYSLWRQGKEPEIQVAPPIRTYAD